MAYGLSEIGQKDKAEKYYRKALLLEPDNPSGMNDLALFLINSNKNLSEGMDLVNKALELNPDNYVYLDTKGWGLYTQGRYHEALELLQISWDLRREKAVYDHKAFLHLEAAKKTITEQKNN